MPGGVDLQTTEALRKDPLLLQGRTRQIFRMPMLLSEHEMRIRLDTKSISYESLV